MFNITAILNNLKGLVTLISRQRLLGHNIQNKLSDQNRLIKMRHKMALLFSSISRLHLPQGAVSIRKTVLLGMVIPMLKIRRPTGRHLTWESPYLERRSFILRRGPGYQHHTGVCKLGWHKRRWDINGLSFKYIMKRSKRSCIYQGSPI